MKTKINANNNESHISEFVAKEIGDSYELYLYDDNGKSKVLKDLNLGSNDLKVPSGVSRELNITDAKLSFKGLQNKSSDSSFNLRLKTNEQGELGYSDEADLVVNIPEEFKGTGSVNSTTITVNHIYPQDPPQKTEFTEKLKEVMKQYKTIDFTPLLKDDYIKKSKEGIEFNGTISEDGLVSFGEDDVLKKERVEVTVYSVISKMKLPNDKDFIVDFTGSISNFGYDNGSQSTFGIGRNGNVEFGLHRQWHYQAGIIGYDKQLGQGEYKLLIIKIQETITCVFYTYAGKCDFQTFNANSELGDYNILVNIKGQTYPFGITFKAKYKILN